VTLTDTVTNRVVSAEDRQGKRNWLDLRTHFLFSSFCGFVIRKDKKIYKMFSIKARLSVKMNLNSLLLQQ
jgi:hypothetical protein